MYAVRNQKYPKDVRSRLTIIRSYHCKFCGQWHIGNTRKHLGRPERAGRG
jgi:hypothetical protein